MKLHNLVLTLLFIPAPLALYAQSLTVPIDYTMTPNQYVSVDGVTLAYREIGENPAAPPLVLLQHITGTMDDWDEAFIDELAQTRKVIVFDNAGVAASQGQSPNTIAGMAHFAEDFVTTLHLPQIDILGFSMGGFVAQQFLVDRPTMVRRVILAGTGPQGGTGINNINTVFANASTESTATGIPQKVILFFTPDPVGIAAGLEFIKRIDDHTVDPEPAVSSETLQAQFDAFVTWGDAPSNFTELSAFNQPFLIVNGDSDIVVPTVNSTVLSQNLKNSQLILYPDAGHGSIFQNHAMFVSQANAFLD